MVTLLREPALRVALAAQGTKRRNRNRMTIIRNFNIPWLQSLVGKSVLQRYAPDNSPQYSRYTPRPAIQVLGLPLST
jgi:hypothetical protein